MLVSDDVFRFTFVRNPYSRLLSAYLSVIDRNLEAKAEILAVINAVNRSEVSDLTQFVSFAEFVDVVCSQKPCKMNSCWKPQVDQTLAKVIDFHFTGQFERLTEDACHVQARLFGVDGLGLSSPNNKTGASSRIATIYDKAVQKRVLRKFESDFIAFGYSEELARALEPASSTVSLKAVS